MPDLSRKNYEEGERAALAVCRRWAERHRGYCPRHLDLEDVLQVARIEAWRAAQRYDARGAASFTTWCCVSALGAVKRLFRDCNHLPRRLQEKLTREGGITEEHLPPLPFSEIVFLDEEGKSLPLDCPDPRAEREFQRVEERALIEEGLQRLTRRERYVLQESVLKGRTQDEIAAELHGSQMLVSRVLRAAREKLRQGYEGAPDPRPVPVRSRVSIRERVEALTDEGLGTAEIAERLGCSVAYVRKIRSARYARR